jgi:hypothetical protein
MMTWAFLALLYFAIPVLSVWISGRQITWQGWVVMLLLWPIAWTFMSDEVP